jgi:hypothetical protein
VHDCPLCTLCARHRVLQFNSFCLASRASRRSPRREWRLSRKITDGSFCRSRAGIRGLASIPDAALAHRLVRRRTAGDASSRDSGCCSCHDRTCLAVVSARVLRVLPVDPHRRGGFLFISVGSLLARGQSHVHSVGWCFNCVCHPAAASPADESRAIQATVLSILLPPLDGWRLRWQPSLAVTFAIRFLLFRLMFGMGLKKFYDNSDTEAWDFWTGLSSLCK